jgi:hypothetical protein
MSNKIFTRLFTLFSLFFLFPFAAFADQTDCTSDSLHCTYLTGLNENDVTDGRYLKVQQTQQGMTFTAVICSNNTGTMTLANEDAKDWLGKINTQISICSDKDGNGCTLVKNYDIVVSEVNHHYVADPALVEINLAPYLNYTRCDASQYPNMKPGLIRHR